METTDTAISLMERALVLLDRGAQGHIACHLQSALDVARNVALVGADERLDPEQETAFFARMEALRAQGRDTTITGTD